MCGALDGSSGSVLPVATRIDIHLEPMEPDVVPGQDVTARNEQFATRMREVVESHPEVQRMVDVELSDREPRQYAHAVLDVAGGFRLAYANEIVSSTEERTR